MYVLYDEYHEKCLKKQFVRIIRNDCRGRTKFGIYRPNGCVARIKEESHLAVGTFKRQRFVA